MSKVFPPDTLVEEAVKLGERISGFSKIAVAMCKEAVDAAEQLPLNEGMGSQGLIMILSLSHTHTHTHTQV